MKDLLSNPAFLTAVAWIVCTLVGVLLPADSKLGQILRALATDLANKNVNATPPSQAPKPPVLPLLMLGALFFTACSTTPGAQSPERASSRAAVMVLADVTQFANHECAVVATNLKDSGNSKWSDVASTCSKGYQTAKVGLYAAAVAIDTWDATAGNKLGCAVSTVLQGLEKILTELKNDGVALTAADQAKIDDAIKLGEAITSLVGGSCSLHGAA